MATLNGYYLREDSSGDPHALEGVTVVANRATSAFLAALATNPPQKGTAVPTGYKAANADSITIFTTTTATSAGGEGAWRITGLRPGEYWVSFEYSTDDVVWEYHSVPGVVDASDDFVLGQGGTSGNLKVSPTNNTSSAITTITNATDSTSRTYTIPAAGAAADFVMTQGAQTITGAKTFATAIPSATITSGTVTSLDSTSAAVTTQLTVGSTGVGIIALGDGTGSYTNVAASSPAGSTVTLPNPGAACEFLLTASDQTLAEGKDIALGTTTGTKIGTATAQKLGFWNATPVVQQVMATGTGKTVDNLITMLQTLGLCKQS